MDGRKQETTFRNWEEEPQETPGTKASTKEYAKDSSGLEETEENEAKVEIVEELVIDKGNCDKEYSTQTPVKTNSKARRDPDGENKLETRRLMNATPEGYRIKEHSPQIRNQRNYKQCMSRNREDKDKV